MKKVLIKTYTKINVECPNCGLWKVRVVFKDELGTHSWCDDCGSSFDIETKRREHENL